MKLKIFFDVVTIGSNVYDVFVKTDAEVRQVISTVFVKGKVEHVEDKSIVYPVGDKILINHLDFQSGGGGTNSAAAFSKLGFVTGYIGKIGSDDSGVKVFSDLKSFGVEFLGGVGEQTGFSVILDSIEEDRTILTSKGCNNDLFLREVNLDFEGPRLVYCSSMIGQSFVTQKELIKRFKKKGSLVVFNPSLYIVKEKSTLSLLKYLDVLIFNKEEAFLMSGMSDVDAAFKWLSRYVSGVVVITDGGNGAFAYKEGVVYSGKPKPGLKIVETTGAGDAFASGFSSGLLLGEGVETCMKRGFLLSEAVIQDYGAKSNLLSSKEMSLLLKKDKRKIVKKTLKK